MARCGLEFDDRAPAAGSGDFRVGQLRRTSRRRPPRPHTGSARTTALLAIDEPRLWSPSSPNLYDLTLELRRGGVLLDRVQSYFGIRSVTAENGKVLLNGDPIFLKMVLDQGYWPESILTPPTDEAIQYDIRITKEMGFNGARKHQKLEDPRYLYWADHLGFLVSSEMANAYEFDDAYVARFTREWTAAVERDYNHPSIVIWVPINESWGVPDLRDPRQQNHLKSLYALTHSLDATRLVIDNDGWEHTDMTDLFAIHDYARTGDLLYERYKDLGKPGAGVPDNHKAALIPGYRYNGSPVSLTEFGGIAFIPPGHEVPKEAWGYSGVEKTADAALERLRGLYSAIARIPGFAGLCYTQLTDVEQEINGLMTYDRKPKFDAQKLREINALVISYPADVRRPLVCARLQAALALRPPPPPPSWPGPCGRRASSVFGPSVYRGPRNRKAIALTFDDGPSESTPRVLELLYKYQTPGHFLPNRRECGTPAGYRARGLRRGPRNRQSQPYASAVLLSFGGVYLPGICAGPARHRGRHGPSAGAAAGTVRRALVRLPEGPAPPGTAGRDVDRHRL